MFNNPTKDRFPAAVRRKKENLVIRHVLFPLMVCLLAAPSSLRAEDHFFDSNGVRIHYIVEGKGEPVVLIHGFTADIDKNWRTGFGMGPEPLIIPALARNYRVIALDNRGHGKSEKPHDPKQYGSAMAEDVVRLLNHLNIKKAHVVGYSMGAIITAKLLATHPDRLRSATLGGHGGIRDSGRNQFYDELASSLEQGKGFGPLVAALTPAGKPKPSSEQIEAINARLSSTNDPKALAAVVRGFPGLAVAPEKLKKNQVPTLALIGELDPLKPGVDSLQGEMANLKVVVIPGADHVTAISSPEFLKSLTEFLARQPSAGQLKKAG
jgi:pimeloyl-ACP methyl ester carboxylesterase